VKQGVTLERIGLHLGQNHATVINSINKVRDIVESGTHALWNAYLLRMESILKGQEPPPLQWTIERREGRCQIIVRSSGLLDNGRIRYNQTHGMVLSTELYKASHIANHKRKIMFRYLD
jgi:hypothetical protein